MRRPRRAVTLVELMVGFGLLAGLTAAAVQNLRFGKLAGEVVDKLDVLQRLRIAELRLRSELEVGTAILHPKPFDDAGKPALVFADPSNRLRVLYVDGAGNLMLQPDGGDPTLLASGIVNLVVKHPIPNQVECRIVAEAPEGKRISSLVSGYVGNQFMGSGVRP